ncbi:MAG: hypothetical protein CSA22_08155 [Deltaproteobacteria bacterium]|nr:MAG: hypothetical protein CSA22_08155 [Deltaproteobacteria bacterium]
MPSETVEKIFKWGVVTVCLAGIAFFGLRYMGILDKTVTNKTEKNKVTERGGEKASGNAGVTINLEQAQQERIKALEQKVAVLEAALHEDGISDASFKEKYASVFGTPVPAGSENILSVAEPEARDQVIRFLNYLDSRPYLLKHRKQTPVKAIQADLVKRMTQNLPVTSGETDDFLSLLRNMAHFYRIFGKERILMIKDVLAQESDILEPVMASYYVWMTGGVKTDDALPVLFPDFDVAYAYAGYFLNTLSGKVYLLRRSPEVRILSNFYCLKVVDLANDRQMNENGIDIRPYIDVIGNDLTAFSGLKYRETYLMELNRLKQKYGETQG